MNIILDDVVNISPKVVLCNRLPEAIDKEIIINFLKNDILLLEHNPFEDIKKINPIMIVLINLDGYLFNLENLHIDIFEKVKKVIKQIKAVDNPYKYVFSVHKFRKIIEMFNKEGLKYYHRVDNTQNEMINIIKTAIRSISNKISFRTCLRLTFKPHLFEVSIEKNNTMCFKGFLRDLSLSGASIEIPNNNEFNECQTGLFLSLRIDFKISFLKIARAVIVRKEKKNNIIGVKMDITDKTEIDDVNTAVLQNIINTCMIKVVDLNFP